MQHHALEAVHLARGVASVDGIPKATHENLMQIFPTGICSNAEKYLHHDVGMPAHLDVERGRHEECLTPLWNVRDDRFDIVEIAQR